MNTSDFYITQSNHESNLYGLNMLATTYTARENENGTLVVFQEGRFIVQGKRSSTLEADVFQLMKIYLANEANQAVCAASHALDTAKGEADSLTKKLDMIEASLTQTDQIEPYTFWESRDDLYYVSMTADFFDHLQGIMPGITVSLYEEQLQARNWGYSRCANDAVDTIRGFEVTPGHDYRSVHVGRAKHEAYQRCIADLLDQAPYSVPVLREEPIKFWEDYVSMTEGMLQHIRRFTSAALFSEYIHNEPWGFYRTHEDPLRFIHGQKTLLGHDVRSITCSQSTCNHSKAAIEAILSDHPYTGDPS